MAEWSDLERELDAWRASGQPATFWWRDDDATRVTPDLERLLAISDDTRTPVGLAIIPRDADDDLRNWLAERPRAAALQHGCRTRTTPRMAKNKKNTDRTDRSR